MNFNAISWLLCLCAVQFFIIAHLVAKYRYGERMDLNKFGYKHQSLGKMSSDRPKCVVEELKTPPEHMISQKLSSKEWKQRVNSSTSPGGVAATLLLHAPTWFQRRYTIMIQNAVNNIPDDWKVQIFYTNSGQSKLGIDINPGINHFIAAGKVILTEIPSKVLLYKRKRFELMVEPWFWESMVADKVIIFGGNSVICGNSPFRFTNFSQFDYIGAPWDFKKGVGGDGGISLRDRRAMIAALNHATSKESTETEKRDAFKKWGQEDQFYVRTLMELNTLYAKENPGNSEPRWKLATREDTQRFAAIGSAVNKDVLVVSGTLPGVPYEDRQSFLNLCPEIKIFYPSLHDPNCFGASPNAEGCAKSICALKSKKERKGGC